MRKPSKLGRFLSNWAMYNIFNFKKYDAFLYIILYGIVPVVVTFLSLKHAADTSLKLVYCYTTILISAAGSFYDAVNRWKSNVRSFLNLKILFILVPDIIICGYCGYEIMSYIIGEIMYPCDYVLCAYFAAILIVFTDFCMCFTREISIGNVIELQNNENLKISTKSDGKEVEGKAE